MNLKLMKNPILYSYGVLSSGINFDSENHEKALFRRIFVKEEECPDSIKKLVNISKRKR